MQHVPETEVGCSACGHSAPHDSLGYFGCVADVMHEGGPPYNLQCCCNGTSGPVVRRFGTTETTAGRRWMETPAAQVVTGMAEAVAAIEVEASEMGKRCYLLAGALAERARLAEAVRSLPTGDLVHGFRGLDGVKFIPETAVLALLEPHDDTAPRDALPDRVNIRVSPIVFSPPDGLWASDGRYLTVTWGEPDAEGFYEPVFTATGHAYALHPADCPGPLDAESLAAVRGDAFEAGWMARARHGEHIGSPLGYAAVPVDPRISHDESCCTMRGCHPICSHLCGTGLHTCDGTDHDA